jgi:hypothetical protein
MPAWQGERIGLVGFGHDFPGPALPIQGFPVVAARGIEPATLNRLGIDTLHHSPLEETALELGVRAGRRALADARIYPKCDHDHVGDEPRPVAIDLAVSLTFAIGSQTSAVVLGAAA